MVAKRKLGEARRRADKAWETSEERVEAQLRTETDDLYNWGVSAEVEAVRAKFDFQRVIDQRDVAWHKLNELKERVGVLEAERDVTRHEVSSLEAVVKCAMRKALG